MLADGLRNLCADGADRIERRHRLLQHQADLAAAHRAQGARGCADQVYPIQLYAAARNGGPGWQELHER